MYIQSKYEHECKLIKLRVDWSEKQVEEYLRDRVQRIWRRPHGRHEPTPSNRQVKEKQLYYLTSKFSHRCLLRAGSSESILGCCLKHQSSINNKCCRRLWNRRRDCLSNRGHRPPYLYSFAWGKLNVCLKHDSRGTIPLLSETEHWQQLQQGGIGDI